MKKQRREESERRESRGGKSQRGEEQKREDKRRERVRRKKMQVREKAGKSPNIVFFQWFVAPEGRKVGLLKRRVRSHLARWEMKSCTPLWRETHLQVKMYKAHRWVVKKVHANVPRSKFPSQNVQSTPCSDHFWKLWWRKSARLCGAKHISESKCTKHTMFGPLLEVVMPKKCTPLWRKAHFQVKMYKEHQGRSTFGSCDVEKVHAGVAQSTFPSQKCKKLTASDHFWMRRCRFGWERFGTLPKVSQAWGFCRSFTSVGRRGTGEEDLQRCIFCGMRSTRDMFIRDVRRSGRWFPERGCIWSIRSSVLGRWFCVTGAAPRMTWPQFFVVGTIF